MDVLKPPLVRIGKRCYRKNPVACRAGTNPEDEAEPDLDLYSCCYDDESCEADMDVEVEEFSGGYRLRLDVASAFFKHIIGRGGETKRRLEAETRCQIRVPKSGQEGELVIQGTERKGVISAKTRIEVLVDSARQRQPFTHFLSIPVLNEEIADKFDDFKFSVMDDPARDSSVDATLFQNPQKLHLTMGTLVLLNQREIDKAHHLLRQCQEDVIMPILRNTPLSVEVVGLEYMNDDPGAVDVLYAKIQPGEDADRLQQLADGLVERFVSGGLMQKQYERVKLHLTVMNTLFRRDGSNASPLRHQRNTRDQPKEREAFNATSILQKFGDFDFGVFSVDKIELSQRYSTAPDGYYQSCGSLSLL